jgi:hypothetical protein
LNEINDIQIKFLQERKEFENNYNFNITEEDNTINKVNNMLVEKQKELELEKKRYV